MAEGDEDEDDQFHGVVPSDAGQSRDGDLHAEFFAIIAPGNAVAGGTIGRVGHDGLSDAILSGWGEGIHGYRGGGSCNGSGIAAICRYIAVVV